MMLETCFRRKMAVGFCLSIAALVACSNEDAKMSSEKTADFRQVALAFTQYLARREYDRAYRMTSRSYRRNTSAQQLQTVFEEIVPNDWGSTEPIEVVETMTSWEGKQASDLGWAYVSIYGDVYSEAITVVVASEENEAKVREVEFGRP